MINLSIYPQNKGIKGMERLRVVSQLGLSKESRPPLEDL